MKFNITTIAIGLTLGFVVYKLIKKREQEIGSKFSSACGCEG